MSRYINLLRMPAVFVREMRDIMPIVPCPCCADGPIPGFHLSEEEIHPAIRLFGELIDCETTLLDKCDICNGKGVLPAFCMS
jgi:hypothetical protein